MNDKPSVSYIPPSADVLEHFAYDVSQGLGGDYADLEVMQGFTNFLKVASRAYVNTLNSKTNGLLDNGIE